MSELKAPTKQSHDRVWCFDNELPIGMKGPEAKLGSRVLASVARCLPTLRPWLASAQLSRIEAHVRITDRYKVKLAKSQRNLHPVNNEEAEASPIYYTLAHFSVITDVEYRGDPNPARTLADVARCAAILAFVSDTALNRRDLIQLVSFSRQVTRSPARSVHHVYSAWHGWSDSHSLAKSTRALSEIAADLSISDSKIVKGRKLALKLLEVLTVLRQLINRQVTGKSAQVKRVDPRIERVRKRLTQKHEDEEGGLQIPLGGEAADNPGPSFILSLSSAEKDEDQEQDQNLLARHGHWLRSTNLLAGMMTEACLPHESAHSMRLLLEAEYRDRFDIAARWVWVLVGSTTRAFDETVGYYINTEHNSGDGRIAAIQVVGDVVTLSFIHPIASKLPTGSSPKAGTVINIATSLPPTLKSADAVSTLKSCSNRENLKKLIKAKERIRNMIRECVSDDWTETRFRGGLVQAFFQQHKDLAMTQLALGEHLFYSYSALHYLCADQVELQRQVESARETIYGTPLSAVVPTCLVGAPKAGVSVKELRPLADWFNAEYRRLRKRGRPDWRKRHNLLVELSHHLLYIASAHRGHSDIASITLWDIGLESGCAIFRDKPSDPSALRRLAVVPPSVKCLMSEYLDHLRQLLSREDVSADIKKRADSALSGDGPLFFQIDGDHTDLHDPRDQISSLCPELALNITRHLQSTGLRELQAEPLLIEAHLGHFMALPLFSERGLLSPTELVIELTPYLEKWMRQCGYPEIRPANNTREYIPQFSAKSLQQRMSMEYAEDGRRTRRLLRASIRETISNLPIRSVVNKEIYKFVSGSETSKPVLDRDAVLALRKCVIEALPDDALVFAMANNYLYKRLRYLKLQANWKVDLPTKVGIMVNPPIRITSAHLQAYEVLQSYRQAFLDTASKNFLPKNAGNFAMTALVLFGQCPSFKEAREWLKSAKKGQLSHGEAFLLIDRGDNDESRTISGVALLFVQAWLMEGEKQTGSGQLNQVGINVRQSELETIATLARHIELPPVFAEVVNGTLPCRELPLMRLRALHDNTCNPDVSLIEDDPETHARKKRQLSSKSQDPIRQYRTLRGLIQNPPKTQRTEEDARIRSAIKGIRHWMNNTELVPIILVLARWAVTLLGPGANLKTTGELRSRTVAEYLGDVWPILYGVVGTRPLIEFDEEELSELLNLSLPEDQGLRAEKAQRLTRFFRESERYFDIPLISLSTGGFQASEIDARIITPRETETAVKHLEFWSKDKVIPIIHRRAMAEAARLLEVQYQGGFRRMEIQGAKAKDIKHINGDTLIHIRPNSIRNIKNVYSKRHVRLSKTEIRSPGSDSNDPLFPELTGTLGSVVGQKTLSRALKICTADTGSRSHHCRHTLATTNILSLGLQNRPLERIFKLSALSARLGHASIRSSMQFYGHTNHHLISRMGSSQVYTLQDVIISKILAVSSPTVRQRRKRSCGDAHRFIASLLHPHVIPAGKRVVNRSSIKPAPYSAVNRTKKYHSLTYPDIGVWLLEAYRGRATSPEKIPYITSEQIAALLQALVTIQNRLKVKLVNTDYPVPDISGPNEHRFQQAPRKLRSKRIPKGWIDRTVKGLNSGACRLSASCLVALSSISWKGRELVFVYLSGQDLVLLARYIDERNIPLKVKYDNRLARAELNISESKDNEIQYIRFFILLILLASELDQYN